MRRKEAQQAEPKPVKQHILIELSSSGMDYYTSENDGRIIGLAALHRSQSIANMYNARHVQASFSRAVPHPQSHPSTHPDRHGHTRTHTVAHLEEEGKCCSKVHLLAGVHLV